MLLAHGSVCCQFVLGSGKSRVCGMLLLNKTVGFWVLQGHLV